MISPTEVVISVKAGVHPNDLFGLETCREEARIDGMAADCLLSVARYLVIIHQVHELWDGLMHEDKVAQVRSVRILELLIGEPIDSLRSDASFTWETVLLAVLTVSVHGVDAENFFLSARVHDWNPRREVTNLLWVDYRAIGLVHVPHVTRPAEIHTVGIVDLVQLIGCLLLNLVTTGPYPRYLAPFDKFKSTRKVIRVIVGVLWVNDVARQHD